MKVFSRLTLAVLVVSLFITCGTVALSTNQPPVATAFELDQAVWPGQPAPPGDECYWYDYYYNSYGTVCTIRRRTPAIYYDVTLPGRIVHDVLYETPDLTVGDLIRQLGTPVGANYFSYGVEIFWAQGLNAYLFDHNFSPNSTVLFVEFNPSITPSAPWLGFKESK